MLVSQFTLAPVAERLYYLDYIHFGAVIQRLREMRRFDAACTRQVGDGARQFQHAVVGACRQLHLAHFGFHQGLAGSKSASINAHA
jgi:hypothetical protein